MELPDDDYPIILNTGRTLYHWHGGTMTTRVDGLVDLVPVVQATINPVDADTYGVRDHQPVQVASRRGSIVCEARVSEEVARGELFMPFVSLQGAAANFLTNNVYDPNGMPEYKVCAVRISPAPSGGQAGAEGLPGDAESFRRSDVYLTGLIARAVARGQRGM